MTGNVCFGCGIENPEGLQIKSYWQNNVSICRWQPTEKYVGWSKLLNGGIITTVIDCHCMCTASAFAYRSEKRALGSQPIYKYATGTLNVKFIKPTKVQMPIELRATVKEMKGKKTTLECMVFSEGMKTVEATVIAIRVFDSSSASDSNLFQI